MRLFGWEWVRFLALALCVAPTALGQDAEEERRGFRERLNMSGTASLEWGIETHDLDTQKFELVVLPEIEFDLAEDWDLTLIPRLRMDGAGELEPGRPNQPEHAWPSRRVLVGDHLDLELRELYVETYWGDTYIKLGKQQIVWGEADGLKVLDVVNPQDFREFILDDFAESRIPLWTVNIEAPLAEDVTLQVVWIPDQTYHNIPEPGAAYEFRAGLPSAPAFIRTEVREVERPSRIIADSDVGARVLAFWKGWDLTLNYLYHYDDTPAFYRSFRPGFFGPRVVVEPRYERSHLLGATFSNAFGEVTIRGELGYSWDKFYPTARLLDRDGVVETDEFSYVLGFDWFGISETFISFQFFQNYVAENPDGLIRDKVETDVSLNVTRDFLNDTLIASLLWVHSLNDNDGFVRPKLSYEYRSNLTLWAGVDMLYGAESGLFGQFNHRDRVIFGAELAF